MPKVALLSSVSGDIPHQKLLLVPDGCMDPEAEIDRILVALATEAPHFSWQQAREALRAAGYTPLEDIVEVTRPWDESRCSHAMTFAVSFPPDAEHEHAGKTLRASTWLAAEGGVITLVDEHGQCLMADDQLWKRGAEGSEQVPLGVILVPRSQFASMAQLSTAIALLSESGFRVQPGDLDTAGNVQGPSAR